MHADGPATRRGRSQSPTAKTKSEISLFRNLGRTFKYCWPCRSSWQRSCSIKAVSRDLVVSRNEFWWGLISPAMDRERKSPKKDQLKLGLIHVDFMYIDHLLLNHNNLKSPPKKTDQFQYPLITKRCPQTPYKLAYACLCLPRTSASNPSRGTRSPSTKSSRPERSLGGEVATDSSRAPKGYVVPFKLFS